MEDDASPPDHSRQDDASPLRSALQTLGGEVGATAISFLRALVIARLLVPTEVGRFALVAAVLGGLEVASNPGLHDSIIKARQASRKALHAVWTVMLLRGILLGLLLYLFAGLIASALGRPDIETLLMWMAFVPAIRSAASISLVLDERRVRFQRIVNINLMTVVLETVLAAGLAYLLRDAAALVFSAIAAAIVYVMLSHFTSDFRPRIWLRVSDIRGLLDFARWRFASNVVWYVSTQGDDLVVGRLAGAAPLGAYHVAYRVANLPASMLTAAITRVAFPTFSKLYDADPSSVAPKYRRYVRLSAGISAPIAGLLAAAAGPLVYTLLGTGWEAAIVPIAIMSLAGFIRTIAATGGVIFLGVGRPEIDTWMQVTRALVLLVALLLVIPFGVNGAAVASVISMLATIPIWYRGLRRIEMDRTSIVRDVALRVPSAGTATLAAWALSVFGFPPLMDLFARTVVFGIIWVAALILFDEALRRDLRWMIEGLRGGSGADGA